MIARIHATVMSCGEHLIDFYFSLIIGMNGSFKSNKNLSLPHTQLVLFNFKIDLFFLKTLKLYCHKYVVYKKKLQLHNQNPCCLTDTCDYDNRERRKFVS